MTSRRRLAWPSAQGLQLDVLGPAAALALLGRIAGPERVAAEPDAAAAIVRLCGHLPLAVRIAGSRLVARPHWPLARMAGRLADERQRLDELSFGDLAVRASLELSYRTLTPGTQRAFRSLGLLDAPEFAARIPAAMLGIAVDQAEGHLDTLIDAQLLTWNGNDVAGQAQYRFHDLVRLHARERAEHEDPAGRSAEARARALGARLTLTEAADRGLPERATADIRDTAQRRRPDPTRVRATTAHGAVFVANCSTVADSWPMAAGDGNGGLCGARQASVTPRARAGLTTQSRGDVPWRGGERFA